jgi:hypothetical protein
MPDPTNPGQFLSTTSSLIQDFYVEYNADDDESWEKRERSAVGLAPAARYIRLRRRKVADFFFKPCLRCR